MANLSIRLAMLLFAVGILTATASATSFPPVQICSDYTYNSTYGLTTSNCPGGPVAGGANYNPTGLVTIDEPWLVMSASAFLDVNGQPIEQASVGLPFLVQTGSLVMCEFGVAGGGGSCIQGLASDIITFGGTGHEYSNGLTFATDQYILYSSNASGALIPVSQFNFAGRPVFYVSELESGPGTGIVGVSYRASIPAVPAGALPAVQNDFNITSDIPEPSTLALLGSALWAMALIRRRLECGELIVIKRRG